MKRLLTTKIRLLIVTMMMSFAMSMVSFARDDVAYENAKRMEVDSVLLDASITTSVGQTLGERSTALATALSEISNEGGGIIGVYANTTMHISVDWACLTIYLERWNETVQEWDVCADFYQEFLPQGNNPLIFVSLQEYVDDEPTGYYYRVRAIHELEYDDGWYEAKVTKTNGILITSTP